VSFAVAGNANSNVTGPPFFPMVNCVFAFTGFPEASAFSQKVSDCEKDDSETDNNAIIRRKFFWWFMVETDLTRV
jgi:hypothetical protein